MFFFRRIWNLSLEWLDIYHLYQLFLKTFFFLEYNIIFNIKNNFDDFILFYFFEN